jgi:hypothetical protein
LRYRQHYFNGFRNGGKYQSLGFSFNRGSYCKFNWNSNRRISWYFSNYLYRQQRLYGYPDGNRELQSIGFSKPHFGYHRFRKFSVSVCQWRQYLRLVSLDRLISYYRYTCDGIAHYHHYLHGYRYRC